MTSIFLLNPIKIEKVANSSWHVHLGEKNDLSFSTEKTLSDIFASLMPYAPNPILSTPNWPLLMGQIYLEATPCRTSLQVCFSTNANIILVLKRSSFLIRLKKYLCLKPKSDLSLFFTFYLWEWNVRKRYKKWRKKSFHQFPKNVLLFFYWTILYQHSYSMLSLEWRGSASRSGGSDPAIVNLSAWKPDYSYL